MAFTEEQRRRLAGPLDRRVVHSRSQAGQTLAYVEGWYVLDQANQIFDWGWDRETVELRLVNEDTYAKTRYDQRTGGRVKVVDGDGNPVLMHRCGYIARVRVTVRAPDGPVVREGTGYGGGYGEDPGLAHEGAVKEAETDATKRALATLGHPLELALYDRDRRNVGTPVDAGFWSDALQTIEEISSLQDLQAWWTENATQVSALPDDERRAVVEAKDAKKAELRASGETNGAHGAGAAEIAAIDGKSRVRALDRIAQQKETSGAESNS